MDSIDQARFFADAVRWARFNGMNRQLPDSYRALRQTFIDKMNAEFKAFPWRDALLEYAWNDDADARAFQKVVASIVPTKLITVDLSNEMPVRKGFLGKLEAQSEHSMASALAATLWSLVKGFDYYFWDTITAAVAIEPSLFTFKDIKIDVSTSGKTMGRTNQALFGRKVQVATQVNKQGFEDLLLSTLSIR